LATSRVDVVIIGGGVAGLWCRWSLVNAGYSVVLLERTKLGDGQTVASQGILHRGVKYALSSGAARAAAAAEESARAWDEAMSGRSGPDLSGVEIVAKNMLMWTDAGLLSKLTGAIASKVLTSHVAPADAADIPTFVDMRGRSVYRVSETVINPASVLRCLVSAASGPIVSAEVRSISPGPERTVVATNAGEFESGAVVLSAGEGNGPLLEMLGQKPDDWMQRRELHMVAASGAPGMLFGHWIASASDKPRLSITSANVGGVVHWYIGGELAEVGVTHRADDQIEAAKSELEICFPGLDPEGWQFKTVRIARAEGKDAAGKRPDSPVVRAIEGTRALAVWPTKLVMSPAAADSVLKAVQSQVTPSGEPLHDLGQVTRPDYALSPWLSRD
jgi:glycine/D-amino acid oxidase-like deaminating enzyme